MGDLVVEGGTLAFGGQAYRCAIGKNGLIADKREGDGCTPVGCWALRECWYRADKLKAPETGLPLRSINPLDAWCDDPGTPNYNRHFVLPTPSNNPPPLEGGDGGGVLAPATRHYPAPHVKLAKKLRRVSTDVEKLLWSRLRNRQLLDVKFRRQQPVGQCIVDFASQKPKLVIELDGGQHAVQLEKDAARDVYLRSAGYEVLRFWNHEVVQNLNGVLEVIHQSLLAAPTPHPATYTSRLIPQGERGYENLWRQDNVYDLIVPLGYNDNPVIPGKGSAIFLHVAKLDYSGTEGCVALANEDLLEVLRGVGPESFMNIQP